MEQKQKRHIRPIVYVMITVFLTIGYAYLTSSLSINGSTLLKKPTWDVHFENIQVKDGSVTGGQVIDEPEIDSEQTTVTFHVNLKLPGDFYEFTVDAVNAGTIDAMIDNYTDLELTEDQQKYLETSITYEDGEEVLEHQQLLAGDTAVYKVRVAYKLDLEAGDLPSNPEQLDLEFTVEYVQRDDSAIRRRAENKLYNVLKDATENSSLARKYTGTHQDSMNLSLSTKDVYHWYGSNNNTDTILDSWNVIFANHCWQMIRTTDTGGVKLLYNGETEDGKCLNTRGNHVGYSGNLFLDLSSNYWYGTEYNYDNGIFSLSGEKTQSVWNSSTYESLVGKYTCKKTSSDGTCSTLYYADAYDNSGKARTIILSSNSNYSQFGTLPFNYDNKSVAYIGYMYNTVYDRYGGTSIYEHIFSDSTLSTSYWYADSIGWDSNTSKYYLIDPYQVSSSDDYASLSGKYTFANSSQTYDSNYIYYIAGVDGSRYYYIGVDSGHNLDYYNTKYTYGDSYTDNGNGTYTINNATTIDRVDWFSNYENVNKKYICKNATNDTCSKIMYSTSTLKYRFLHVNPLKYYVYASGFTYENGKYTLNSDRVAFWDYNDTTNRNSLSTHHYSCFNDSGECNTIKYVLSAGGGAEQAYIEISNGKSINDAINEMFYNDDVNVKSSTIKKGVDEWYRHYLINYSDYLEDVVFCGDRVQVNQATSSWYPNGSILEPKIEFIEGYSNKNGLNCANVTDQYSVSNPKAQLTYKVGLMTYNEAYILNSRDLIKSGNYYFLLSPMNYYDGNNEWRVGTDGHMSINQGHGNSASSGVRPVISLKPGTFYTSGDGSMANPYVVSTN